ncbi:hypothetical protein C4573_01295 [Candidatus Woesearchaeota archaeon]|nr:MAG: hypothetical protein C4573_01295 [Candidatus Woesearchaeota archaeon]
MFNVPLPEIKQKIKDKTGLSEQEVNEKIKEKLKKLSGLISEEGAAHILANELGIKLLDTSNLKIKNIMAGMRHVDIIGKATQVGTVKEFASQNRAGKLGSFSLHDETGSIRVVLWNDQAEFVTKINQGDVVKIKAAYVRNNTGKIELHLNDLSKIAINPEGETVNFSVHLERKQIKALTEQDQNVELLATIVQVYEPRFYEVCPTCNKKVKLQDGVFICDAHKEVIPSYGYLLSLFLDDGSSNIRTVFFKSQMQNLLAMDDAQILQFRTSLQDFEVKKNDLLGSIVKVIGRVSQNQNFNRTEFVVNKVFLNPDPEQELQKLNKDLPKLEPKKYEDDELYTLEELEEIE